MNYRDTKKPYSRPNSLTDLEKETIRQLAATGMMQIDIAKKLGRSPYCVNVTLREQAKGSQFFCVDDYAKNVTTI
jgi:IS30 family transposase